MPELLKLALVTDIHNGQDSLTKKGAAALGLLHRFVDFAEARAVDLVLDLGDRISDVDRETDRATLAEVAAVFERLKLSRHHIIGNHDLVHLGVADNADILGQDCQPRSLDLKGWHLVFWQANVRYAYGLRPMLDDADLNWLRADLQSTSLPAIVFSHVPLDGASMTGNYYFEANPAYASYGNIKAAQRIIAEAGNVALCVGGHVHWNNLSRIDGIPYLSLQSLTESFTSQGEAAAGWALIEADHELRWRGFGGDPIELTVNLGGGNRRWRPPLPEFGQLRRQRAAKLDDLSDLKGMILDLDGVVYRGNEALPGAVDLLNRFIDRGGELAAVTNNARASAEAYAAKLAAMGLELPAARIITSAQATARHLAGLADRAAVFIAGPAALRDAVLAAGAVESPTPDFVVAGYDGELAMAALADAVGHLRQGARLIASNGDVTLPGAAGLEPEAGAVVAFLEAAGGCRAEIAGKPNPAIFRLALAAIGLEAGDVIMVGDTLATDIAGAIAAGIRAVRVLSGNPESDEAGGIVADLTVDDLAALAPQLGL